MKRTELNPNLQKKYRPSLPCGVARAPGARYANLWFVVPPAPPRKVPSNLPAKALLQANRLIEQLVDYEQATELDRLVSYLFVRREAVQSSRMEGTWSTVSHVLTPGEVYDKNEGKTERASVLGYAQALEKEFKSFHKRSPTPFTPSLASRLHREIMSKDPHFRGVPGRIREPRNPDAVVWIGEAHRPENSIYNPTPPQHVRRCLKEVLRWFSDEELIEFGDAGMGMPLPVRLAIGHSHFEAVHPFGDGNGRVGRMLMTLQMVCRGKLPLYLSGYIEAEKIEYGKALQDAQKKLRYGAIVEFICNAIVAAHREAAQTQAAIRALPEKWTKRGEFRQGAAALRWLPHLLTHPIFTVKQLGEILAVSPPAANHAARQLVQSAIARERTGFGRNRVFAAEEVIELLSRRFGDGPELALERAQSLLTSRPEGVRKAGSTGRVRGPSLK